MVGDAMNRKSIAHFLLVPAFVLLIGTLNARAQRTDPLAMQIEKLDAGVLQDRPHEQLSQMLREHVREGLASANRRSSQEWREISSREQWESFKCKRLEALRASLGRFPEVSQGSAPAGHKDDSGGRICN